MNSENNTILLKTNDFEAIRTDKAIKPISLFDFTRRQQSALIYET